ncbi:hypothetical protein FSP39_019817 [Pinctada imbricata]|uniref:Fucosyltransferase n=1 Tax=Pinctada imbricata TaxID=66713 RepID=A0AA88XTE9_PINIB|nr:hypothetical protein FSP39_019817 [Pinctada imbricata]
MKVKKCFLCAIVILAVILMAYIILYSYIEEMNDGVPMQYIFENEDEEDIARRQISPEEEKQKIKEKIDDPIIIWWTGFTGERGRVKQCGKDQCFFTVNRHYRNHPKTKVFIFYGTDLKAHDLPIPREPHHEWGLLHEESPKNNYLFSHSDLVSLFNHTATFKRQSHYPITTQYLQSKSWLEKKDYMIPTKQKNDHLKELSPLIYTHSDCNVPSDRDNLVSLLQKHINVDSYGTCVHNKDLPPHLKDPIKGMFHKDFYKLNAKYKFTLALENGICDDYITEKIWRPLMLGSVPIIHGSPKIKELLPSNMSAIVVSDFNDIQSLANHIKFLNENDAEYEKYLHWKKTGITNPILLQILKEREWVVNDDESLFYSGINFIEGFECFVCKRVNENLRRARQQQPTLDYRASADHYGCPAPLKFDSDGRYVEENNHWSYEYSFNKYVANQSNITLKIMYQ